MATLSVEGESGLVRGEASVPERLAAVAQAAARRHEPWHGAWAWPRRLRESDQAFSIINTKSTRKSRQKSPKSDIGLYQTSPRALRAGRVEFQFAVRSCVLPAVVLRVVLESQVCRDA